MRSDEELLDYAMDEDTDIEGDPDEALDESTNEPEPAPKPTFAEVIGAIDVIKN